MNTRELLSRYERYQEQWMDCSPLERKRIQKQLREDIHQYDRFLQELGLLEVLEKVQGKGYFRYQNGTWEPTKREEATCRVLEGGDVSFVVLDQTFGHPDPQIDWALSYLYSDQFPLFSSPYLTSSSNQIEYQIKSKKEAFMSEAMQQKVDHYLKLKQLLQSVSNDSMRKGEREEWIEEYQALLGSAIPLGYDYVASYHERNGEVYLVEPGDPRTDYICLKDHNTNQETYVFAEQFMIEPKKSEKIIVFPKQKSIKRANG